jgi:hypothetical protein
MIRLFFLSLILIVPNSVHAALVEQGVENIVSVCSDGKTVYFLNETGKVYSKTKAGIVALDLPDQVVSVQALEGSLFFLRTDGAVWQYLAGDLHLLDGHLPTRSIRAQGDRLFLLKESGFVVSWKQGQFRNLVTDRQFRTMVPYGQSSLVFMDRWGRVFRYDTYSEYIALLDSSPGTIQMVAGLDSLVVLKRDGSVYKYVDREFHKLNIQRPVREIATDGKSLYFIDIDRKFWEMDLVTDMLHNVQVQGHPDHVFVAAKKAYVSTMEGQVYGLEHSPRAAESRRKFHRLWNTPDFNRGNNGLIHTDLRTK